MGSARAKAVVALAATGLLVGGSAVASAPVGSPPATYDYDAAAPGTQAPRSPILTAPDYRSVRTYQVTFPVLVPTAQLQAALPTGYQAQPSATGATTSVLNLAFFLDQRFELVGTGTSGPVSAVLLSTTVLNTTTATPRQEIVFPAFEASGSVEALDAAFGPGSAQLADVSVELEQADGETEFRFRVRDPRSRFEVTAEATAPAALTTRAVSDPVGLPFRTLDGRRPNGAFRAATQSDGITVPTAEADARLRAPGGRLHLPGGSVDVVGLGASITVARDVEFVVQFED